MHLQDHFFARTIFISKHFRVFHEIEISDFRLNFTRSNHFNFFHKNFEKYTKNFPPIKSKKYIFFNKMQQMPNYLKRLKRRQV